MIRCIAQIIAHLLVWEAVLRFGNGVERVTNFFGFEKRCRGLVFRVWIGIEYAVLRRFIGEKQVVGNHPAR